MKEPILKILALVVIAVFMLALGIIVWVNNFVKESESYQTAIFCIENDQNIIKRTGGITGYGWLITSKVVSSGRSGRAYYKIPVDGLKEDVLVEITLVKDSLAVWEVQNFTYC